MPNTESLSERLVRGMNLTGTWVPLTQEMADVMEFPEPGMSQVYQLPADWGGDDIPDVAAEVCVLERALELSVDAHISGDFPKTRRVGESGNDMIARVLSDYIDEARAELEREEAKTDVYSD